MNTELEEIPEDGDQPATKGDLHALEQRTNMRFDAMLELMQTTAAETRDHFDVVAENIHQDVAAANKDEFKSLSDKVEGHGRRIAVLERPY